MVRVEARYPFAFTWGVLWTVLLLAGSASAEDGHPSGLRPVQDGAATLRVVGLGPGAAGDGTGRFIIRFVDQPLALYPGGIDGLVPTNPAARGEGRLDVASQASRAYVRYLEDRQSQALRAIEAELGRALQVDHRYRVAFNGIAAALSPKEARRVAGLPEVAAVTPERVRHITTDAGPEWIGSPGIWDGSATGGLPGTMGEGIVVGVVDTGIYPAHPSFADIGGDGYDHANPRPGFYGVCNPVEPSYDPGFPCNDKLIGAWNYSDGPIDNNGHGTHTASTAAGNFIDAAPLAAPTITLYSDISGVAPHAAIIAYDACDSNGSCPGAALVDAINQAVADGVDVINYSIGGGSVDPWSDPEAQAFAAADAAGIFVATSAGNSGPTPSTIGSPADAPWVTAVGATTHDRHLYTVLAGLSGGDTTPPSDITGKAVTAGHGPAPIVYAGDFGDQYCLSAFAAGTWTSGEIVVCDRGGSRIVKGSNVQAGGGGGLVVVNTSFYGEFVPADEHAVPAVHIGYSAGETLKTWLASGSGHTGTIVGTVSTIDPAAADVMARFSSRGPNPSVPPLIKPDVVAPGADIVAADETGPWAAVLSGTSMASPHVAGAAALLRALHPTWTPAEVKSALMMTAQPGVLDDNGFDMSYVFDHGSGRVDLGMAGRTGLIMDESAAAFAAADPTVGGDPRTLNLASMADIECIGWCSWTRSLTNTQAVPTIWAASSWSSSPETVGLSVSPPVLTLAPGATAAIEIEANAALEPGGSMALGAVALSELSDAAPDAHLPFVVWTARHSNAAILEKSVDAASATPGNILTYDIQFENWTDATTLDLVDPIRDNATYVAGSASGVLDASPTSFTYESGPPRMVSSSTVLPVSVDVAAGPSPYGYVPLATWYSPIGCPADCDDGGFSITGMDFYYGGRRYETANLSVNGAIEAGTASGVFAGPGNVALPSAAPPDNLLAPFWTDLDMRSAGDWYIGALTDGTFTWDVFEWENVPEYGDAGSAHTIQVWFERGSDNIHFIYGQISPDLPGNLTVGAENRTGVGGDSHYFNGAGTAPAVGTDLVVTATPGSIGTFSFQVQVGGEPVPVVNIAEATLGSELFRSTAVTTVNPDCAPPWDHTLAGHTVTGVELHTACRHLTVEHVDVMGSGDATFCGGLSVSIGSGFGVAPGATVAVGTDSTLGCSF